MFLNIVIIDLFFIFFRLALYVYEYLLHVGAQKSAQTFLSEVSILKLCLLMIKHKTLS